MTRSSESGPGDMAPGGEIDLTALGAALKRRRLTVIIPTLIAFALVTIYVNVVTPRYTSEAQVLLENQETFFTRPDRGNAADGSGPVDQEGVASQVQLIASPDIARQAIAELGLAGNSEFDPSAHRNPLLSMLGLGPEPSSDRRDARTTQAFLDKLSVFSPPKTRVITIQFTSRDPKLAARAANLVADLYIQEQSAAKRAMAKESADALAAQITDLRTKLANADAEREQYRSQTGLLAGSNNMTIFGQQLADINSDLSKARSIQADAEAKASTIRDLLRSGRAADVTDVTNNDIVRRIWEERSTAQAQLALESRTLMPGHPRVKALQAQVDAYDATLKAAARQAASSLENEAKIAGSRVTNLELVLTQQKRVAGTSNVDEVHMRALDRTSDTYKAQLESSTTKYQEALARQSSDATPADARVIGSASRPEDPSFPKKLPFIAFGTLATLFFSVGFIVAGELLSTRADVVTVPVRQPAVQPAPIPAVVQPDGKSDVARQVAGASIRTRDLLRKLHADPETEPDLVFAPVEEPRAASHGGATAWQGAPKAGLVAATLDYLKGFGRSAADSRVIEDSGQEPEPTGIAEFDHVAASPADIPAEGPAEPAASTDADVLAERIVAAHVPGRGLHIVGTSLGHDAGATAILIDLSRLLSGKGRSIIVDLNRTATKLASLCDSGGDGRAKVMTMSGLSELLDGTSSFSDAIHRDHASRLHFIPTGRQEADFGDFDLILDALSETYDFIVMLAPAFPQSEIAKVMAPYADFVVLTAVAEQDNKMLGILEKELVEAGAREVLVAGTAARGGAQDVA